MYEQRFGLTCNPFRIPATGSQVFVGPQQAKVISSLQKALSGMENVVTVSGPAGVGKTAIVTRALETNKAHHMVAWIGRMRLAPDDVLTLLLSGFGLSQVPNGAVQRFAIFKQILNKRAEQGIQVVVVVEDALRLGNDTLLELEAITASEGGNSGGANIILMGPPEIDKRLNFPELARLRQRARNGRIIERFSFAEVQGYMKHCVRIAGGQFDELFEDGAAAMVYRCSEGIPRVINNICESALKAAAEAESSSVSAGLIRKVAASEHGIEPVLAEPAPLPQPPEDSVSVNNAADANAATEQTHDEVGMDIPAVVADVLAQEASETPSVKANSPDKPAVESFSVETDDDDEFPGDLLIADTGMIVAPEFQPDPDLDIPASQLADEEPGNASEEADEIDDLPMLSNSMRVDIEAEVAKASTEESYDAPVTENTIADELPSIDDIASELDIEETATHKSLDPDAFAEAEMPAAEIPEPEAASTSPTQDAERAAPDTSVKKSTNKAGRPVPDLDALEAAITAARRGEVDDAHESTAGPEALAPEAPPVVEEAVTEQAVAGVSEVPLPLPVSDSIAGNGKSGEEKSGFSVEDFEEPVPEPRGELETDDSDDVPVARITLDQTLEDQREEGLKLDALAAELASVDSLEEISDKMAETLFGIEFEQIAADAIANPPASGYLPGEEVPADDIVASPALAVDTPVDTPANDSMNDLSPMAGVNDIESELPDPEDMFQDTYSDPDGKSPDSDSMPVAEEVVLQEFPAPKKTSVPQPGSIEDQFKTGITQTLEALNTHAKEEIENAGSGGFLGKLKKTLGR